jgi:acetyl esterase/lipase
MPAKLMRYLTLLLLLLAACTHKDGVTVTPKVNTGYTLDTSVVYGTDSQQQQMDVFLPPVHDSISTPVVILIHGGAWVQGSKMDFYGSGIDTFFAANGCAVVTINYRLDGKYPYPASVDDIGLVMNLLKRKKAAWQINPDRVCLLGKSSGSQLAMLYAYAHNQDGRVKAVIDGYGPTDFVDSSIAHGNLEPNVKIWFGADSLNQQVWHDASPIFYTPGAVPTVIIQGSLDIYVEPIQSELLMDSLNAHGKPYLYIPWVGNGHGWDAAKWLQCRAQVFDWVKYFL